MTDVSMVDNFLEVGIIIEMVGTTTTVVVTENRRSPFIPCSGSSTMKPISAPSKYLALIERG